MPSPAPFPLHFQGDSQSNLEKHLEANSSPWLETLYLVLVCFFVCLFLLCFSFCLFLYSKAIQIHYDGLLTLYRLPNQEAGRTGPCGYKFPEMVPPSL